MKSSNYGVWIIGGATVFVVAWWVGIQPAALVPLVVLLACPLMMVLMMNGMHGGDRHDRRRDRDHHEPRAPR